MIYSWVWMGDYLHSAVSGVLTLTVAPHVTLMSEPPVQNWLQGHPLNRHLEKTEKRRQLGLIVRADASTRGALSHLPSISMIFGLVYIEQTGQSKVGDLHVVWVLHQDIASSQISVHQADFLQITHALHTYHICVHKIFKLASNQTSKERWLSIIFRSCGDRNKTCVLMTDLSNLDTPIKEQLGTDAILVLPDVFKQAAVRHQLGDQLHGGGQADPQQTAHVRAGHSCHNVGLLGTTRWDRDVSRKHVFWSTKIVNTHTGTNKKSLVQFFSLPV